MHLLHKAIQFLYQEAAEHLCAACSSAGTQEVETPEEVVSLTSGAES